MQPPGGWVKAQTQSQQASTASLGTYPSRASSADRVTQQQADHLRVGEVSLSSSARLPGADSIGTANSLSMVKSHSSAAIIPQEIQLLQPLIDKHLKQRTRAKILKPRPAVLYGDKLVTDSFAPGADPLNYFEQDRRLGYQKPRMWFPGAEVGLRTTMLPEVGNQSAADGGAQEVVREFLQMRALASYVGDLVTPFNHTASSYLGNSSSNNSKGPGHGGQGQGRGRVKMLLGAASAASITTASSTALVPAARGSSSIKRANTLKPPQSPSQSRAQSRAARSRSIQGTRTSMAGGSMSASSVGSNPSRQQQRNQRDDDDFNEGFEGVSQSRLSGFTDHSRFNAALQEVAKMWTPLLGIHLPLASAAGGGGRKKRAMALTRSTESDLYQEIAPFKLLSNRGPSGGGHSPKRRKLLEGVQELDEEGGVVGISSPLRNKINSNISA